MILLIVPPIRPCRSLRPAPSAATPRCPRRAVRAAKAPRRPGALPRPARGHAERKGPGSQPGRVKQPQPKTRAERAGADEPPLGSGGLALESGFAVRRDVVYPILRRLLRSVLSFALALRPSARPGRVEPLVAGDRLAVARQFTRRFGLTREVVQPLGDEVEVLCRAFGELSAEHRFASPVPRTLRLDDRVAVLRVEVVVGGDGRHEARRRTGRSGRFGLLLRDENERAEREIDRLEDGERVFAHAFSFTSFSDTGVRDGK